MDKGLKILFDTYWDTNGWKEGNISQEDFLYAKSCGYMFDYPKVKSHNDALAELRKVLKQVSEKDIANAFLYSLSTRKLEYRSALGSYWYAISIPDHEYIGDDGKWCNVCNWSSWKKNPSIWDLNRGLNVYNFERYKFGGVRYTYLNYALFDLKEILKLPKVKPTDNDKKILREILMCTEFLKNTNKAGKLREAIRKNKIVKSNIDELSNILNILGICGILESKDYPCYQEHFVKTYERDSVEYKNDFQYPVNRWRASDGINYERFEKVFKYKF